jgi:hypothetical protein
MQDNTVKLLQRFMIIMTHTAAVSIGLFMVWRFTAQLSLLQLHMTHSTVDIVQQHFCIEYRETMYAASVIDCCPLCTRKCSDTAVMCPPESSHYCS